jgi:D-tagatose-1,6-bisphosphate aldolase subunit GatZ/KbaZ
MSSQEIARRSALQELVRRHKSGEPVGMPSICSAHPLVLEACMRVANATGDLLLVEATSNQVNQFGGYTGMVPAQFAAYARDLAAKSNLDPGRVLLGGDHLGPNAWRKDSAEAAMQKACVMVRDYVLAGFQKIHLDASMRCAGDPGGVHTPLPEHIVAERAAELCSAAEAAYRDGDIAGPEPVYVIGTEVPTPGGEQEAEESIAVTTVEAAQHTIEVTKDAFESRGLQAAWERVIAVVVQPGVEFSGDAIHDYRPDRTFGLSHAIEAYDNLLFEAHSTDYQREESLQRLVHDHFAILKVGPGLTYAFREAVFALELIEREWLAGRQGVELSGIRQVIEQAMIASPGYWEAYYHGDEAAQRFARGFSLSDRIRYYWPAALVQEALTRLTANLSVQPIPLSLISQFMPRQYEAVRSGALANSPHEIVLHRITEVVSTYARACERR